MAHLLRARGLHTYDNELTSQPGSLEIADNIVIDKDGVIEPRRGFEEYGDVPGGLLKQLLVYKDRIIRHYSTVLQFDDGSGTFSSFSGTYSELESGLRIKYLEANGNFFFTTDSGIKKISATSSSDFSTASDYITNAGGVKAVDLSAQLKVISGGFMPPQSKVAYRLVWGITDNNNNLILGSPSSRVVISNTSADINTSEVSNITVTGVLTASEYVLFSSRNTDYFVWFNVSGSDPKPQTDDTLGRTAIEADVQSATTNSERAAIIGNSIADATSEFTVEVSSATVTLTVVDSDNTTDISSTATNITVGTSTQGKITSGDSANVELSFSIPSDIISTNYFYQIYRTAVVEATTELTLDELEPGDEMQLVLETGVTTAELAAGTITVEDITAESFRESGAFLYTNPVTGEGILQANERPPIAKDIALFRNSTFYANTKTSHRQTINFLSVTGFTSGTSQFIIGNSDTTREYTFIGETEVSTVTCDSRSNTTNTGYILLNSARDERKYYVWFDTTGSTADPAVSERIGVKVDISTVTDSAAGTSSALQTALNSLDDFDVVDNTGSVTVTNVKNGNTDDISIGSVLGGSWAVAVSTQGDGEDAASNEVLLSSQVSVGQSIDETARSLVSVVNKDSSSPVYAYYLSGPDDLPGIILFENRSLEDNAFYIATNDTAIQSKFNPELPETNAVTSITFSAGSGSPANINDPGHGLSSGDQVYIFDTATTPAILGEYEVTVVDVNNFTVPVNITGEDNPSSAFWFKTDIESNNDESKNRVYFSKADQPEAVPIVSFIDVGPKDKGIQRIIALRDNLFALKEDGVYIITGSTFPNFNPRLLDSSVEIIAPDTASVLNNQIYVLSTQGVVTVTDAGVSIVSRPIEDKILEVTDTRFNFSTASFGVSYESDRAYHLWLPSETTDTVATQAYRYNVFTRTWTRWIKDNTCGVVNPADDKMYLGSGSRNYLQKERKDRSRIDHADRDFDLAIPNDSVNGNQITLSTVSDVEIGDSLVQTQTISMSIFNRLLRKLDLDLGLDDIDYESTLEASVGDDMTNKLDSLNTKIVADDSSGTVSAVSFSTDFTTMRTQYNVMIGELNQSACDTNFKNYKTATLDIPYEVLVTAVNTITNTVTVNYNTAFIQGSVTIYKGYQVDILYSPQHFDQPDLLKQVREGTIIFDQNNFYSASLEFSSDLSPSFVEVPFFGRGNGAFGDSNWEDTHWGGQGSDVPFRTLIPLEKQRCRYLNVRFKHINARESFRILGISAEPRALSKRAYR